MQPEPERIDRLADRVARLVALRHTPVAERKVAIVLFNFPPNSGAAGTAAHLSVFESLFNTLSAMRDEGYPLISRRLTPSFVTPFSTEMPSNLGPRQMCTSACR